MTDLLHIHHLLKELKLQGMTNALERILKKAEKQGLSIQEVLHDLLIEEKKHKQERSMHYRINQAKLPFAWTLETFPFHKKPSINKTQIMTLAGLEFVQRGENIVFIGGTGNGKTGLALGLLRKALVQGYRGKFYKVQDLLDELYASLADRTSSRLFKRLCNLDLLLLDELGYLTLNTQQMNMFFKLLDERYTSAKSSIITTNLKYEKWYDILKPKSMVDALLDRLMHNCVTISIEGDTLRQPKYPVE